MNCSKEASTRLATSFGTLVVTAYRNAEGQDVTAICSGELAGCEDVPVRIHSACFTSEALGSLKCDCKEQLDYALQYIAKHGGVVVYLPQEGRGIGFGNKIKAYALQEQGYDTIEANEMLGLPIDCRTYEDARDVLLELGVKSVRLLTNNPLKLTGLAELGITVTGRLPVSSSANAHSVAYMDTKREQMGHMLEVRTEKFAPPQLVTEIAERPFVHVNFALDDRARTAGRNGRVLALSCDRDWQRVHELREKCDAVAVGAKTWLNDNPSLTARVERLGREPSRQPDRVVFAGHHQCVIPIDSTDIKRDTFVIGQPTQLDQSAVCSLIAADDYQLTQPLAELRSYGIESLLVEGGLTLIQSFMQQQMVDLVTIYVCVDSISDAVQLATQALPELAADQVEVERFGQGILLRAALTSVSKEPYRQYGTA